MKKWQLAQIARVDLFYVLDRREKLVVRYRIGCEGRAPKSLENVAKILGITRECVLQIENRAAEKMIGAKNHAKK
jgi:DNA-directed RNA polymerase sigma subunit (sigma70/sigma32)